MFDKDHADTIMKSAAALAQLAAERDKWRDVVSELVAADDLRAKVMREKQRMPWKITKRFPSGLLMQETHYKRQLPAAWAKARALLNIGPLSDAEGVRLQESGNPMSGS